MNVTSKTALTSDRVGGGNSWNELLPVCAYISNTNKITLVCAAGSLSRPTAKSPARAPLHSRRSPPSQ